jgi:6-phosphogluconolactonase
MSEQSPWREHVYVDAAAQCEAVAGLLAQACRDAVAARGSATLALAGGSTPMPVYQALAAMHLPWHAVVLVPTDERCVPRGHPASNAGAIRRAFAAAPEARVLELVPDDGDASSASLRAGGALAAVEAPFDVVLLGMGADTHVASLFPGARGLAAALAPESVVDAVRVDPEPLPPEAPFPRISMTVARLRRTRGIHLLISGARKRQALQAALAAGDRLAHPVLAVMDAAETTVHVHWSP